MYTTCFIIKELWILRMDYILDFIWFSEWKMNTSLNNNKWLIGVMET
jgi:hypothetical protein